jgi:hypothetical protein
MALPKGDQAGNQALCFNYLAATPIARPWPAHARARLEDDGGSGKMMEVAITA